MEEVFDLHTIEVRHVVNVPDVFKSGITDRNAQNLVVGPCLVGHPEHPNRPAADETTGEGRLLDEDQRIQGVSVAAKRVVNEPVVVRVSRGGEEHPVELDTTRVVVELVLVAAPGGDLDRHVEVHLALPNVGCTTVASLACFAPLVVGRGALGRNVGPLRHHLGCEVSGRLAPTPGRGARPAQRVCARKTGTYCSSGGPPVLSSQLTRSWLRTIPVCVALALLMAPAGAAAKGEATTSPAPGLLAPVVLAATDLVAQPSPTASGVAAALRKPLTARALGGSAQYSVFDPASNSELAGVAGQAPATPASTTKVLTAAAVLQALGADARLATTVTQTGPGRLTLVGGGDPLLQVRKNKGGSRASLAELARRTSSALRAAIGQGSPSVQLDYDDSLFAGPTRSPSWEASYTKPARAIVPPIGSLMADRGFVGGAVDEDPGLATARAFADRLRQEGVKVRGAVSKANPGRPATPIAQVFSPPMADLVGEMLRYSDNVTAEVLGHLAGGRTTGSYSFTGGAEATMKALMGLGVSTVGLVLRDASGLSRSNLIPPITLAQTLAAALMNKTPELWSIIAGLPVAGFDGTLADRFVKGNARAGRGYVRAKTGTLTGVSALAGTVVTASGRTLVFAFMAPRTPDTFGAEEAWDRAASVLAGCGCGSIGAGVP